MNAPFQHQRLDTAREEIRLLSVLPGEENDPLRARLFHVPLNNHVSYRALSYAWNDPMLFPDQTIPTKVSLFIDGQELKVGQNLAAYLHSTRQLNRESSPTWVDAICINQEDIAERSAQVLRMKAIYQNASLVIVWLGPDANFSEDALAFVNMVYGHCKKDGTVSLNANSNNEGRYPGGTRMWSSETKQWVKETLQDGTFAFSWAALQFLFSRSWWYRTWISQEVFLAKEILVVAGAQQLPWEELDSMIWNIVQNWTWLKPLLIKLNAKTSLDAPLRAARIASIRSLSNNQELLSLLRAITLTRNNFSTDSRDKVYGVLGLVADTETLGLQPDYSLSLVDIHKNLLLSIIDKKGNLDYFGFAGSYGDESSLPSWCANLDRQREVMSLNCSLRHYKELFFSAGNTKPVAEFLADDNILKVKGFQVDVIEGMCARYLEPPYTTSNQSSISIYQEERVYSALWKSGLGGLDPTNMNAKDYTPCEPRDENGAIFLERCYAVENSLVSNSDANLLLHRASAMPTDRNSTSPSFDQWYINNRAFGFGEHTLSEWTKIQYQKRAVQRSQTFPTSIQSQEYTGNEERWADFFRSWAGINAFRRVITTQKGYIGLAPCQSQEGDVICIFLGGKMPVVLRPKTDLGHRGWEFIGECYLHGIMFGESVNDNNESLGEDKMEEFEIY